MKAFTILSPSARVCKHLVSYPFTFKKLRTPKEISFMWVIVIDIDYIRN